MRPGTWPCRPRGLSGPVEGPRCWVCFHCSVIDLLCMSWEASGGFEQGRGRRAEMEGAGLDGRLAVVQGEGVWPGWQ